MRSLLILLLATTTWAQTDWAILSSIEQGRKMKLKLARSSVKGTFQRADVDSVTILSGDQERSHQKTAVIKVALRTGKARAVNAAKGAGIGAAIGAVLGIFVHGDLSRDKSVLLLGANGAAYGAGIGALIPGYTTVYRAP